MSKARSMYAGSSGMINGANAMTVQFGNKLQGLAPTRNKSSQLISHIQTKAYGDKRNYLFCVNQLSGGVGRRTGQFVPSADGVNDCKEGDYALLKNEAEDFQYFQALMARFVYEDYINTGHYIMNHSDTINNLSSEASSTLSSNLTDINDVINGNLDILNGFSSFTTDNLSLMNRKLLLINDYLSEGLSTIVTSIDDKKLISDVTSRYSSIRETVNTASLRSDLKDIITLITDSNVFSDIKEIFTLISDLSTLKSNRNGDDSSILETMKKLIELAKKVFELIVDNYNSGLGSSNSKSITGHYKGSNVVYSRFKPTSQADLYIAIYLYFTGALPDYVDDDTIWTQDDIDNFLSSYSGGFSSTEQAQKVSIGSYTTLLYHDFILDYNTENITDMSYAFSTANYSYSMQKYWTTANPDAINDSDSDSDSDSYTYSAGMKTYLEEWEGSPCKDPNYVMNWNTSSVTDMSYMFNGGKIFSASGLVDWDTSSVTNMSHMFDGATYFNTEITSWDTTSVTDMSYMFKKTEGFDRDIGSWDVSNVTNMQGMFYNSTWPEKGTNQVSSDSLNDWDVNAVADMSYMFYNATVVDLELDTWSLNKMAAMSASDQAAALSNMFNGATAMLDAYSTNNDINTDDNGTPSLSFFTNTDTNPLTNSYFSEDYCIPNAFTGACD